MHSPSFSFRPLTAVLRPLSTVLCLVALAGCNLPIDPAKADAVRYFSLGTSGPAAAAGGVRVLPVVLAGHLQPRELAVRIGDNEVTYLDEARWAEAPAEGFTSLLRARLAGVAAEGVLRIEISRCEPLQADQHTVDFRASYTFSPAAGGPAVSGTFAATPRAWDGRDPAALVGLYRSAVEEFSATLAAALGRK